MQPVNPAVGLLTVAQVMVGLDPEDPEVMKTLLPVMKGDVPQLVSLEEELTSVTEAAKHLRSNSSDESCHATRGLLGLSLSMSAS